MDLLQKIEILKKALNQLEQGLNKPSINDLERDGLIQRFEYTFELAWKLIYRFFMETEIQSEMMKLSKRDLFRLAFQKQLIQNIDHWFLFLEKRNLTSHTYQENISQEIYSILSLFTEEVHFLILEVEKRC